MASAPHLRDNGSTHPSRKLRFDDWAANVRGNGQPPVAESQATTEMGRGHSGRRFVVVAVIVVLLTWGGMYLAFNRWRASYRERVAYGKSQIASAVLPLKDIRPADVDPTVWHDTVEQTRAMLMAVVASNLLDRDDMDRLRHELDQFVARVRAHPETARTELGAIWNQMADRAEFLFQDSRAPTQDRHVRPQILPPRPAKGKTPATAKTGPATAAH